MNIVVTNPLGFLALLGIPVVLLIHFLQRRPKVVPISTLFLLERSQPESSRGKNFERIINSIPLWLQLLLVLLLTWLLIQPRYKNTQTTQRIAIVLDSSASMRPFKDHGQSEIINKVKELRGYASNLELWVLESDPAAPRLYYGSDLSQALNKIKAWSPSSGAVNPRRSLQAARSLAGPKGALLYVTDTPNSKAPYNANILSIGKPIANCGFTGIEFDERDGQLIWKAIIRNYSATTQSRSWHLSTDQNEKTSEQQITLAPNSMTTVQGLFPENATHCILHLSEDEFDFDNQLPLVKPQAKQLLLHCLSSTYKELSSKMIQGFPNVINESVQENADIFLGNYTDQPSKITTNGILFLPSNEKASKYLSAPVVTEKHPLVEGLSWQGLLVKDTPGISPEENDQVLVWQGNRPLIFVKTKKDILESSGNTKEYYSLIFNFDINQSNLAKQDAFAVLLLRFCEQLRENKESFESLLLETGQTLAIKHHSDSTLSNQQFNIVEDDKTTITMEKNHSIECPDAPGFMTITSNDGQQSTPLLDAAVYFADTREADFSKSGPAYSPATVIASTTEEHTSEDHLWRYWCLAGALALLLSWHYSTSNSPKNV
ncbi:hypothetical protein Rhal01_00223 [Rubritalea halochordaticola]|uniref:Aerotolerance regulator N-terminal domain-containing protein n=2 Tax=Rubritalea halochordaticola TaxID=714537 RepID=A0ABP9UUP2_9BACT